MSKGKGLREQVGLQLLPCSSPWDPNLDRCCSSSTPFA
jgi:hypothetical protein